MTRSTRHDGGRDGRQGQAQHAAGHVARIAAVPFGSAGRCRRRPPEEWSADHVPRGGTGSYSAGCPVPAGRTSAGDTPRDRVTRSVGSQTRIAQHQQRRAGDQRTAPIARTTQECRTHEVESGERLQPDDALLESQGIFVGPAWRDGIGEHADNLEAAMVAGKESSSDHRAQIGKVLTGQPRELSGTSDCERP